MRAGGRHESPRRRPSQRSHAPSERSSRRHSPKAGAASPGRRARRRSSGSLRPRSSAGSGHCGFARANSSTAEFLATITKFAKVAILAGRPAPTAFVFSMTYALAPGLLSRPSGYGPEPVTMSCRIDRQVTDEGLVILCISGRITAKDLDMLRDLLAAETGAVAIDLGNVLLVDRDVVKLLMISEGNGVELRNCPGYVREWIAREKA